MNHEFVIKMMKAKKMEVEALKELLPDSMKPMVAKMEQDAVQAMKEFAMDFAFEHEEGSKDTNAKQQKEEKKVKKVKIDG